MSAQADVRECRMRIPPNCDPAQCPFEAAINRLYDRTDRQDEKLDRMNERLTTIAEDVTAIKAGAVRDRWWQGGVMWLVGVLVGVGTAIAAHFRNAPQVVK